MRTTAAANDSDLVHPKRITASIYDVGLKVQIAKSASVTIE